MTRAESGTPRLLTFLFLASALAATDASSGGSTPGELRGAYMGQRPPGDSPELFLPGVVSTGMDELNSVFSPDGKTFLFSIKLPGQRHHTLVSMHQAGGRWTDPEVLPFSGVYGDADPAFDASGERVFFISTRPDQLGGEPRADWDIWVVEYSGESWGEPRHLDAPVNTDKLEVYPCVAGNGSLYFSSGRDGGMGNNDIYRAPLVEDGYGEPVNLGGGVNSEHSEGDLFVAPDESYIVFVSSGRPDSRGRGDLYVSFRRADGGWSTAANLGDEINTGQLEYCPVVTHDEKFLFFTSYRWPARGSAEGPLTYELIERAYRTPATGLGDVYWVGFAVVEKLRPKSGG